MPVDNTQLANALANVIGTVRENAVLLLSVASGGFVPITPPDTIEVALNSNDDAPTVASKTKDALDAKPGFGATVAGNKITVTNADMGAVTDAADGDTTFTFNVTTQGDASHAEVTEITCVADNNGTLSGRYFDIHTPSGSYYVWYNVDNASRNPTPHGKHYRMATQGAELEIFDNGEMVVHSQLDDDSLEIQKLRFELTKTGQSNYVKMNMDNDANSFTFEVYDNSGKLHKITVGNGVEVKSVDSYCKVSETEATILLNSNRYITMNATEAKMVYDANKNITMNTTETKVVHSANNDVVINDSEIKSRVGSNYSKVNATSVEALAGSNKILVDTTKARLEQGSANVELSSNNVSINGSNITINGTNVNINGNVTVQGYTKP